MKISSIANELNSLAYHGRGIIIGKSTDGKTLSFTTQMNPDANTNPTAAKSDISYLPTYLYYEGKFN